MRKDIEIVLRYLRRNADRMRYQRFRKTNRPIGSGAQEASCKTLATQRLKLSGMSWCHEGAQGVLTLRALGRSGRAWDSCSAILRGPQPSQGPILAGNLGVAWRIYTKDP